MSSSRTTTVLTIAGVTVLGVAAYALYFDYKRRNDTQFRKKLRKQQKRVDKSIASSKASLASSTSAIDKDTLRAALEQVKSEEVPAAPELRETYFMSQVGLGEQLATTGEEFYLPAALSFFRALRVYPSPVELMVIYQKTVPEPVFNLIIELTNLDVSVNPSAKETVLEESIDEETSPVRTGPPSETSSQEWDKARNKIEGFYHHFPPKSYNVSIVTKENGKRNVILNKDVKAGETIYKEQPLITALDVDVQAAGTHCSHCLRVIESEIVIKAPQDPLLSVYCSKTCQTASKEQSHTLLFSLERSFPEVTPIPPTPQELENRRKAQVQFVEHLKKSGQINILLLARFIARRLIEGTKKLLSGSTQSDFPDADNDEYSLDDHIERLRYVDAPMSPESMTLLTAVLIAAVPTLQSYMPDEQLQTLLGKMVYNGFGVCYNGGRDNKPAGADSQVSRTPYGTSRQIGTAFYTLSSYLNHSCTPSACPEFANGTAELHLIATRDLKQGDELTVAYINVDQHPDETPAEGQARRQAELMKGWKFACQCDRCQAEAENSSAKSEEVDGSKVENSVKRWETLPA